MITSLNHIKSVYMLGIGGIGMSALARYFKQLDVDVKGYDLTPTQLTQELEKESILIHYNEDINQIDKNTDLVIYTPAIPTSNVEFIYYQTNGYHMMKRSEALGAITKEQRNICVAGTHGKTTTSTLTAYLLRECGIGGTAFLGGTASNYNTNFWTISQDWYTIEADEFDRSFLCLSPDIAVISSTNADHLDIYKDELTIQNAYIQFAKQIKHDGILFYKKNLSQFEKLNKKLKALRSYDVDDKQAFIHTSNLHIANGVYVFNTHIGKEIIENCQLPMGGKHNVENAIVSIAIAHEAGISSLKIVNALKKFKGIHRRFNIHPINKTCFVVDDYAHHPEEINCLIEGVNELFPSHECLLLFQPHLYSRTRDFAKQFSKALSKANKVALLNIYPAREKSIENVNSEMLLNAITHDNKSVIAKEDLQEWANTQKTNKPQVFVMAGAGDIDNLVKPMMQHLKTKYAI